MEPEQRGAVATTSSLWSEARVAKLANGLQLLVEERAVPKLGIQIQIQGAGGYYDPPDAVGLAYLASRTVDAGTATRTGEEIQASLKEWDAELWLKTSNSSTVTQVSIGGTEDRFEELIHLGGDIVRNATVGVDAVQKIVDETRRSEASEDENVKLRCYEARARFVYGQHPGGRGRMSAAEAQAISSGRILDFVRTRYVPETTIVAIVGAVRFDDALRMTTAVFGDWQPLSRVLPPVDSPQIPEGGLFVIRSGSQEPHLSAGAIAVHRGHEDFEALELLGSVISSGGRSGRLFATASSSEAAVYQYAHCQAASYKFGGEFKVDAMVAPGEGVAAVKTLYGELERLRSERASDAEIDAAKDFLIEEFQKSIERAHPRILCHVGCVIHGFSEDHWTRRVERIRAITGEQVRAVAEKYLAPSKLVTVLGAPGPEGESRLEREVGPFTVVA